MTGPAPASRSGFGLVAFSLSLLAFLYLPPSLVSRGNMIGPEAPDEWNYMAHATAIAYFRFDYDRELQDYFPPNHALGPGILASPVVMGFSLVDRIIAHPVIHRRDRTSLRHSWTGYAFGFATQLYLVAGAFLLYLTLSRGLGAARPAAVVLASIAGSGILYYAYRRPVSSHVYEFFLLSVASYLVFGGAGTIGARSRPLVVGAVASLIFLVRYNDLPLAIAFVWASLAATHAPSSVTGWLREPAARRQALWIFSFLALVVAVAALHAFSARSGNQLLWNLTTINNRVFRLRGPGFFIERFFHVFFGSDWSLFMTAPLVLLGLASWKMLVTRRQLMVPFLIALVPNFMMILSWGTQGSAFGYRYFVFAALPFSTLGLSAWVDHATRPARFRVLLCAAAATVPAFLLLVFNSTGSVGLSRGGTPWGTGWVNNNFIANAFMMLLTDPAAIARSVLPRTGIAAVAQWAGMPDAVPGLGAVESAKLVLAWILPAAFGCALAGFFDRKSS